MRRGFLRESASDLASLAAVFTAGVLAFATWTVAGLAAERTSDASEGRGSPEVSELAAAAETKNDTTTLDRADVAAAAPKAATAAPKRRLNVVLVTIDTLRHDLGFAGYPRPVSPNIDALAARSVVYEHAYAMASFTPKCLGPMLIGRYVSETQRDYEHYTTFYPANVFLAERVHAAGGHSVGAASHRYFGWKTGFAQGFDIWDTSAIPPKSIDNDPTITSERLTNVALELLGRAPGSVDELDGAGTKGGHPAPFFAWFHYLDPHLPYVFHEGAPNFAAMPGPGIPRERAAYDGEVWFTDQQVGRLLEHIARQPWANDTAIILTADHGEAFGERSHWGHGRELWEPLVHVPLVVYVPGAAPRRIAAKRSHIDIVPTVLELMGIAPDPELHGKSLGADIAHPDDAPEERDVYVDMPAGPFNDARYAILTGPSPGMKLIDYGSGRYELYDLHTDPRESKNLVFSDPGALRQAKEALVRMRATIKELPPSK